METTSDDQNLAAALLANATGAATLLNRRLDVQRKAVAEAIRKNNSAAYVVAANRAVIMKLLANGDSVDEIADVMAAVVSDSSRDKLLTALRRLVMREKKAAANRMVNAAVTPDSAAAPADVDDTDAPHVPGSDAQHDVGAHVAKDPAPAPAARAAMPPATDAPADNPYPYRREPPFWTDGRYRELACLQRHDGEIDADYNLRMWHTPPPWKDEVHRHARDSDISYYRRCWMQGSPEERAAQRAALPPTAR